MADAFHHLPGLVPSAVQRTARVVENVPMARDTWRMRLACPEMAGQIVPGQFFMVRLPGTSDPLLARPFALYDVYEESGGPAGVDFGYTVIGKMTSRLARLAPGDEVEVWGPLGNGFPVFEGERLMLVAGGIGQTPFLAVAREALGVRRYAGRLGVAASLRDAKPGNQTGRDPVSGSSATGSATGSGSRSDPATRKSRSLPRVTLCYGVRSAAYLAGVEEFAAVPGLDVRLATDDGSRGRHGFVTDLLRQALESGERPDAVYCCGPEPMMHATARLCARHGVRCWLSLESPMACGFGACFSCVTPVRQDDGTIDYRRTCVEGPVFPAERLALPDSA